MLAMGSTAETAASSGPSINRTAARRALIRAGGGRLVTSVRGLDELLFGSAGTSEQSNQYSSLDGVIDKISAAEEPRDAVEELAAYVVELVCCDSCAALWFDDSLGRSAPIRGSFFSKALTDRLVEYLNGGVVESVLPGGRPALIPEKEIEGPDSQGTLVFVPVIWDESPLAVILSRLPCQEVKDAGETIHLLGVASKFAALRIDWLRSCLRPGSATGMDGSIDDNAASVLSPDKAISSMAHSINNSLQVVLGAIRLCI
jgi:hypothetical protein